jgi:hypothetical protein
MSDDVEGGWGEFDDGLDPDSAQEDLGDFTIEWLDAERRFKPATVRAKLLMRGKDVDVEFVVDEVKVEPEDIIEVRQDLLNFDGKVAEFTAELTEKVRKSPDFYKLVATPVEVTILVKPALQTMAAITTAPESIKQTCRVGVSVPPPRIVWEDGAGGGVRNPTFELEADGEDTMELHVRYERWDPAKGEIASDITAAEFSHMTDRQFHPAVFGPHPDSKPWEDSSNGRMCSLWKSNMVLPNARRRETLPWEGNIRVKAWKRGDIIGRPGPNRITLRPGAKPLAMAFVPVRLGPTKIKAEKLQPRDPIPADGLGHEVVLRFTNLRTGRPLKDAEVSWELATGEKYPGGTIDPGSAKLTEADGGHVRISYAPPALTYEPGGNYRQELRIFAGSGEHRREADPVILYVSPEVRAELLGEKCGIDFEPPYVLTIPPERAPEEVVGHHGLQPLDEDAPDSLHVFDATPTVTVLTNDGPREISLETSTDELDASTNEQGLFTWRLPELAPGLANVTAGPRRRLELEPFKQESVGDFDENCRGLLGIYRGDLQTAKARETLNRLLLDTQLSALRRQPQVMAKQLAAKPETDCEKCKQGTRLVLASVKGTVIIDAVHAKLFDQALDLVVKFAWDALDVLIKVKKVGDKIVEALTTVSGKAADLLVRLFGSMQGRIRSLADTARRLFPEIAQELDELASSVGPLAIRDNIVKLLQTAQNKILSALISLVRMVEENAVNLALRLSTLDEAIGYGIGKGSEKIIKEASKAVQKVLSSSANSFATYADMKAWLRSELPLGMQERSRLVVGTTATNVAAFSYPMVADAPTNYVMEMEQLAREQVTLDNQISGVDAIMSTINLGCDLLALAAVLAGILTLGAGTIISIGALSTISLVKIAANGVVHAYQGFQLFGMAGDVMDKYGSKTLALTRVP